MKRIKYICAECGGIEEDSNTGCCVHGHDNWMEAEGILPSQVETFEKNLGISINIVFGAFNGDKDSIKLLKKSHKQWEKNNSCIIEIED